MNNTNERAGGIWPLVERRSADRRQQDRRQPASPDDALADDASHLCTSRERQTIRLLLQGMTNKQIAHSLGIAEDTVKKHLHHVYKKLGVPRRALLMIEHGGALLRGATTFVE